jgi:hypothetical protein
MTRGPVHEAFATPATEPVPTKPISKEPPKQLEEMPPDQKPEGNVVWIGGYWAWDDDRNDFLWVSGIWRALPPGKHWVAGYWREDANQHVWVPGFWAAGAEEGAAHEVTYLPQPPKPPEVAPPGEKPTPDSFFVPGHWVYQNGTYAWQAGYWAQVQPGYVWVPAHYRWTPTGYIYIPGYWDLALSHRGVMYAPVVVDVAVVGPRFVYVPAYAVPETVVVDYMFVRPCYCHYYFGDYYEARYREIGFESCVVYSRSHYEPIFVYERWDHRHEPAWETTRLEICIGCSTGRIAPPPRTLVQRNITVVNNVNVVNVNNVNNVNNVTNINNVHNTQMVTTTSALAAAHGTRAVAVDPNTRVQAQQQAQNLQQVAAQRQQAEVPVPPGQPIQPRVAAYNVPKPQAVAPGMKAAAPVSSAPARPLSAAPASNPAVHAPGANTASTQPGSSSGQPGTPAAPGAHPGTGPTTPGAPGTGRGGQPGRSGQPPAKPPVRPNVPPNNQHQTPPNQHQQQQQQQQQQQHPPSGGQ